MEYLSILCEGKERPVRARRFLFLDTDILSSPAILRNMEVE
jgi:hypothetical protein